MVGRRLLRLGLLLENGQGTADRLGADGGLRHGRTADRRMERGGTLPETRLPGGGTTAERLAVAHVGPLADGRYRLPEI